MEMSATSAGDTYNIFLQGNFTFGDNPEFRESVLEKISLPSLRKIVLHMQQVDFIDSAALGMLLLAHDEAEKHQKSLILHGVDGQVRRIFNMARFDQFFKFT